VSLIAKNSFRLLGKCPSVADPNEMPEIPVVLGYYFGKPGEIVSLILSIFLHVAIIVVAYILLSQG